MPLTITVPLYEDADHFTGHCSAAVLAKRFLKISADRQSPVGLSNNALGDNLVVATCLAGEKHVGVSGHEAAIATKVDVISQPGIIVPVAAGAALTAGQEVQSDATGRAILLAAGKACGLAVTSQAVVDSDVFIKLYA